jgi:hypothetical protein
VIISERSVEEMFQLARVLIADSYKTAVEPPETLPLRLEISGAGRPLCCEVYLVGDRECEPSKWEQSSFSRPSIPSYHPLVTFMILDE